jgi:hypothetical protein
MTIATPAQGEAAAPALFIGHKNSLLDGGGGVQICNREYVAAISLAGYQLEIIPFEFHNTLFERVKRRFSPRVFAKTVPAGLTQAVDAAIRRTGAQTIFFSLAVFPELSKSLRSSRPQAQQVLLSHGVESIDFCIEQRVRRRLGRENRSRAMAERMLGAELLDEVEQRRFVDKVLTLSPFEVEIEQWLGAKEALWVPRTIMEQPLALQPVDGRVGCVATLSHPPNLDGLVSLFDALQDQVPANFRFRLVGGPPADGELLAGRYRFIEFLGKLTDEELRAEARTWCGFVHPMFVFAKGCSTKLAVALGWGLPIVTTTFGIRGYVWDEAVLPVASTPGDLASLVVDYSAIKTFDHHKAMTDKVASLTPDMATVSRGIRSFLNE